MNICPKHGEFFGETCVRCKFEELVPDGTDLFSPAIEELVKPQRYNKGKIEVWDFILDQGLGFLAGNIVKYLCRSDMKGGLADLKKARIYLDKLIAEEEKK